MRQKSCHAKIPVTECTDGKQRMNQKDRIFDSDISKMGDFVFDDRVVSVFPDMINRSVPGYGLIVPMIGMLARRYAQKGTNLYDLGCSLGAVSIAMRGAVRADGVRILAVDNSEGMIRQLHSVLDSEDSSAGTKIELLQQDVLETPIENASVVVLNFTLQFVEPADRSRLLEKIAEGMNPGGILILSEKIRFQDAWEQELQTSWHHDFKRSQGYSELEIARKRDALENVMKPETMERHRKRLREAGFERTCLWFQGFNFVSMVAFGRSR